MAFFSCSISKSLNPIFRCAQIQRIRRGQNRGAAFSSIDPAQTVDRGFTAESVPFGTRQFGPTFRMSHGRLVLLATGSALPLNFIPTDWHSILLAQDEVAIFLSSDSCFSEPAKDTLPAT